MRRKNKTIAGLLIVVFVCHFLFLLHLHPCPIQAKLFRIFQEVLNAPPTKPTEELRKLAIYMVRQFVASAQKNPKVYAELFFWKTVRECAEMENKYEAQSEGPTKGWSESQEDELRRLFQENQENPENDQGTISSMSRNDYFFVDA